MRAVLLLGLSAAVLLGGCSSSRRCAGTPAYQKEATLPAPGPVEGLTVPESASALRIPDAPENSVPYGRKVKDPRGGSMYECLDVPPRLNPPPVTEPANDNPPKS